ncbi:MAG: heat-inducible transcription repressor HrcA [Acidimicrobiia bacterium]|nr:heat-inducible transcription repressor HrcA [Acidimicrobiia bacterium]
MLDERKAAILAALVEEHIHTGEPVSSRTILDHSPLHCSSATIRNEMVVLEHEGYIVKPHTSAGRVPTDRGYRYYIDHLSAGPLRRSGHARVEQFFATIHLELDRMLKQTSELLADVAHYPSVVVGPPVQGQTLRDAHLLPVSPDSVLLVLVTERGRVTQSLLRLGTPVTPSEVSGAERALGELVSGRALEFPSTEEGDRTNLDLPSPVADLVGRALQAVAEAARADRPVFLGGTSLMTTLWEDLAKLHRILALLEREASVLQLVDDSSQHTTVRLGMEVPAGEEDLAVVSAPYEAAGATGRVGLFGPRRMDYRRAIKAVEEVSDALGDTLGG